MKRPANASLGELAMSAIGCAAVGSERESEPSVTSNAIDETLFNGEVPMRVAAMIAVASFGLAFASGAAAQEALAKSSGCLNCHAVDTKKVGPSFKDVAAKYKG